MPTQPTDSHVALWRTLIALAHADGIMAEEEIDFLRQGIAQIGFTEEQTAILESDIDTPQDPEAMFEGMTDIADQARFFALARKLVWADKDYAEAEQGALQKLSRRHIRNTDLKELVGKVEIELDDAWQKKFVGRSAPPERAVERKRSMIQSFTDSLKGLFD